MDVVRYDMALVETIRELRLEWRLLTQAIQGLERLLPSERISRAPRETLAARPRKKRGAIDRSVAEINRSRRKRRTAPKVQPSVLAFPKVRRYSK